MLFCREDKLSRPLQWKSHHPLTVTIGIGSKTPCLALPTTNRRSPSMVGQSISVTEAFQLLAAFFNHLLRSRSSCFAESSQASIKMGEQFSRCLRGCFNAPLFCLAALGARKKEKNGKTGFGVFSNVKCQTRVVGCGQECYMFGIK